MRERKQKEKKRTREWNEEREKNGRKRRREKNSYYFYHQLSPKLVLFEIIGILVIEIIDQLVPVSTLLE